MNKPLDPEKHFKHLAKLLELEEAEEINQFREAFLNLTPEEREKRGKALLRLALIDNRYSPGGHHLLSFRYINRQPIPLYTFDIGDVVTLERDAAIESKLPSGTVYEKDKEQITVAFDWVEPEWLDEGNIYHLSVSSNRITYKKMKEALEDVKEAKHSRLSFFRDLSL